MIVPWIVILLATQIILFDLLKKKELGLKLDHFDILALQRYNEKMKGQHEKK